MPPKAQEELKASLLQLLVKETQRDVRNGICELVASLCKFATNWPELIKFINELSNHADPQFREVSFRVLQAMTETVGKMLKSNFANLQPLLRKGLVDQDNAVRVRALRAINGLVQHLETEKEVNLLRPLIEPAVKVIGFCVENNFVSDAIDTLDLFNDLIQDSDMDKALEGYLGPLMQFMINIVRNRRLDLHLRNVALSFVQNVASLRTKQFLNNKWLQPTLEVIGPMFSEPLPDDVDDDDTTAQRVALLCIDVLCAALPDKFVGPAMLQLAAKLHSSPNWLERKGCLETLSTVAGSCFIFMRDHLSEYLPALKASFTDQNPKVRMTAFVTLAKFSDELQEPLVARHEELVPCLAAAMRDNEKVALRAMYALQFFSEELRSAFAPYADGFMTVLMQFCAQGSPQIKDVAIGAVGSIATALGPAFAKYLAPVISMLSTFMSTRDEALMEVRGRACEVAGAVALAVGRQVLGDQVLQNWSRLAFETLQIDSEQHAFALRAAAYGYFTQVSSVLGPDFMQMLNELLPVIMASVLSEEGVMGTPARDTKGLESLVEAGDDDEEGGDGNFTEGDKINFAFRMPFVEEKRTAITLLASLANSLGKHMVGHIERILPELLELCDYMHADVRQSAIKALPSFVHIVYDTFPSPGGKWERGKFSNERPLNQNVRNLLPAVLQVLVEVIKDDRDLESMICAVESLSKIFSELGPASFEEHIKEILPALLMVFEKKTHYQELRENFDEDERDLELFNAAVDCVVDMMRCAGPTPFGLELFKTMYPRMVTLFKQPVESYRALGIGALAEFVVHVENQVQPVAAELLKMAMHGGTDEDLVTKRNSLYLMGAVLQFGGPSVMSAIPTVLTRIQGYLKSDDAAGIDNAVGALSRIILTGADNLPLADMLKAIFANVPLKIDVEPYGPMFQALIKVSRSPAAQVLLPYLPVAVKTALHALLNDAAKLDHRSKPAIEVFVRVIGMGEHKAVLQQVVQSLPPFQQAALKEKYNMSF